MRKNLTILLTIFKRKPLKSSNDLTDSKKSIEEMFDYLLESSKMEQINKYLDSGYQLTLKQFDFIITNRRVLLNPNNPLCNPFYHHCIEAKNLIDGLLKQYFQSLESNCFLIPSKLHKNKHNFFPTNPQFHIDIWKKIDYLMLAFDSIAYLEHKDYLALKDRVKDIECVYEWMTKVSKTNHWRINTEKFLILLKEKYDLYCIKNMDKSLIQVQEVYSNIEKIIIETAQQKLQLEMKGLSAESFPTHCWEIAQQIKDVSAQIDKSLLNQETYLKLDNIVKKIPEVFKNYIGISQDYKEQLRTVKGQTADELLTISLEIIKQEVVDIYKTQQTAKLTSLDITSRYLQASSS